MRNAENCEVSATHALLETAERSARRPFATTLVGTLVFSVTVAGGPGCYIPSMVDSISARSQTDTSLLVLRYRIDEYWKTHRRVPESAARLPAEKHREDHFTDGWGRDLLWQADGGNSVKVWSLGRDGLPGGVGEDEDVEMTFNGETDSYRP